MEADDVVHHDCRYEVTEHEVLHLKVSQEVFSVFIVPRVIILQEDFFVLHGRLELENVCHCHKQHSAHDPCKEEENID